MLFDQGFKVGDRVYYIRRGVWGTVTRINGYDTYPVQVTLECGDSEFFKYDGREYDHDVVPSIVFEEITIVAPKRKFVPTLIGKNVLMSHRQRTVATHGKIDEEDEITIHIENEGYFRKENITSLVEVTYGTQNLL